MQQCVSKKYACRLCIYLWICPPDSDDEEPQEEEGIADTEDQETGTEGAQGGEDPGESSNDTAVASTSRNAKSKYCKEFYLNEIILYTCTFFF